MSGSKFTQIIFNAAMPVILLLLTSFSSPHPFYVSLTEIRLDTRTGSLQVSCRMFTDDLESAIKQLYLEKTDLQRSVGSITVNGLLSRYVSSHLEIRIAGEKQTLEFIGYETEEESTWCHLERTGARMDGPVQVTNTILFDFIDGQINMIHCYKDEERQSTKLNKPEKEAEFIF